MPRKIVVVENLPDWQRQFPELELVSVDDYLTDLKWITAKHLHVINLCSSHRYLGIGYYCSLIAEARGHRVIPSVRTMIDLGSNTDVRIRTAKWFMQKPLSLLMRPVQEEMPSMSSRQLDICFGQCAEPGFADLARRVFETYPAPMLRVRLALAEQQWRIVSIKIVSPASKWRRVPPFCREALNHYLGAKRRVRSGALAKNRFDIAILRDEQEQHAPSNPKALKRFVSLGEKMGLRVELIDADDLGRLSEFDALFIRETTKVVHHTYRFATRAESLGLAVIDDPASILQCANKVYLAELMKTHGVPTLESFIVGRPELDALGGLLPFPMVLKLPEGAFSLGVFKVSNEDELHNVANILFNQSDLILAQAYMYTPFDWRIGILDGKPLFACQYFMSRAHWQVVQHHDTNRYSEGAASCVPLTAVPEQVIKVALKAAGLIGNGLYGVDLKETAAGVYVIEINDNPNIDAGLEDRVAGDQLYQTILESLVLRIRELRGL